MSELTQMRTGKTYNCLVPELQKLRDKAATAIFHFNQEADAAKRQQLLESIGVSIGEDSYIAPPFNLSYGCHLSLGKKSYINCDAIILDNGWVEIGSGVMIGPRVQIYTAAHALDAERRLAGEETAKPVVIEDRVWIGGGAIILPGVRVGKEAIVGAGAVVTRDVAPGDRVAGNPAKSLVNPA